MFYAGINKYRIEVRNFKTEVGLDPKHVICVKNRHNREIDYDIAVYIMGPELREQIHREFAPCSDQEFYNEYSKAYLKKTIKNGIQKLYFKA